MDPNTVWEGTANPPNYSKLYPSPTSFQKVRTGSIGIIHGLSMMIDGIQNWPLYFFYQKDIIGSINVGQKMVM